MRSLSYETTRREHYTTGRYREVVGHATRAYLACRFPGRWEAAIDELGKAAAVRRRSEDIDDIPVMQNLQEWLAAAELEYITEVASRPPEDNTSAIWRDAIRLASKTPVPPSKTAPTSTPPTQETDTGQGFDLPAGPVTRIMGQAAFTLIYAVWQRTHTHNDTRWPADTLLTDRLGFRNESGD